MDFYKVLIVDDEKDIVDNLKPILERADYDVVVAYDGQEALEQVQKTNPDILILDLMMPKLDGFQVLKEVRQKHQEKWRPIVIMSARGEMDDWKRCHDLEADLYLTKPCTADDILHALRTMVSLISVRGPQ